MSSLRSRLSAFFHIYKEDAELLSSKKLREADAITQAIYAERVRLLYANGIPSNIIVFIASLILSGMMLGEVAVETIVLWLAGLIGVAIARVALIIAYNHSALSADPRIWAKRYALYTAMIGFCWAWFVLIAYGHTDWLNILTLLVTFGMGSLAVPVLAFFPAILLLYFGPAAIVTFLLYSTEQKFDYLLLNIGMIIYVMVIMRTGANFFAILMTSLQLRFEKEAMAKVLRKQKENADSLNEQLEQEVRDRRSAQRELEKHQRNLENQVALRTAELLEAKEAAEAGSRAKSDFLASMSHEIRTPMNGVLGATQLLLSANMEPRHHHYVQIAHESATNLLRLINDILDFSKIESGQLELVNEDFDLVKVCRETLQIIEPQIRTKGLQLVFDPPPDLPAVLFGDDFRLRQILLNLLGNAAKFTGEGQVELIIKLLKREENICHLSFTVRDSGIGIDAAALEKIFKVFTQEDNSITRRFGGSGLGLSITHSLVEAMGGTIHVESVKGVGSSFQCTLPFAIPEQVSLPVSDDELTADTRWETDFSGRILLAEDNEINQIIARDHLETLGFEVDTVDNGIQAREARGRIDYRLILMDCHMPEMDGFDATKAIRQDEQSRGLPRIPIIALTADAQHETRARCEEVGMDDYMSKPFNIDVLAEKIRHALPAVKGQHVFATSDEKSELPVGV